MGLFMISADWKSNVYKPLPCWPILEYIKVHFSSPPFFCSRRILIMLKWWQLSVEQIHRNRSISWNGNGYRLKKTHYIFFSLGLGFLNYFFTFFSVKCFTNTIFFLWSLYKIPLVTGYNVISRFCVFTFSRFAL